jgi:DNA repair protein RadC
MLVREISLSYGKALRVPSEVIKPKIGCADDAVPFLRSVLLGPEEKFCVLYLMEDHKLIGYSIFQSGATNMVWVSNGGILRRALLCGASKMVVSHNHPTDEVDPSFQDKNLTKALIVSGSVLGIPLMDHIIISENKYFSYAETGRMRDLVNELIPVNMALHG